MNHLGIIEDGAVLIKNSKIAAVGPTRRLENLKEARNAAVIQAAGRVVLPGFVDPALHLMVGGLIRSTRSRSVARIVQDASAVLRSALQHGTTRAEIKVGGDTPAEEMRFLRQTKRLDPDGEELVRTWLVRAPSKEASETCVQVRETAFGWMRRRAPNGFFEVAATAESADAAQALAMAASQRAIACKLHWRDSAGQTLAALLSRFSFHAVSGLEQLETEHIAELAAPGTTFVFTAGNQMWNRNDQASLRALLDANGAVAIASGYDPVASPVFNMQMAIAQAVLQMKMTTEEAITAATINAAHVSGVASKTGSLEFQKEADLLLLNLADYRELPRQFGINHVGMVIRSGSVVFNRIGWKAMRTAS
jgi:imidazolonepropionase